MKLKEISDFFKSYGYKKDGNYFVKYIDDDWGLCFAYSKRANQPFSFAYGVFCKSYSKAMNEVNNITLDNNLVVFSKPINKMNEYGKEIDDGLDLMSALSAKVCELEEHGEEYVNQIQKSLIDGSVPEFLYIKRVVSDDHIAFKYRALIFKISKGQLVDISEVNELRHYIENSSTPRSAYLYNLSVLEEYLRARQ